MGRARRQNQDGSGPNAVTPSSLSVDGALAPTEGSSLVPELLELPDGSTMELEAGDPALLMRGLAQVEGVQFMRDGTYQVRFRDGDVAHLLPDEGRIAFASGRDDSALALAAFARAFALRSSQSGDPMGLSMDPATKRLFAELDELHRQISENPNDPNLLRRFAQVSQDLMQNGLLHDPNNLGDVVKAPSKVMPGQLDINGAALSRQITGEEEDLASLPNHQRRAREYARGVNEAIAAVRSGSGPFADNPMAAFYNAAPGQPLPEVKNQLSPEQIQERMRAALIVSGQIDPNENCPACQGSGQDGSGGPCPNCRATGHRPTGKYEHLTPWLDGKNPEQTHGLPITITAESQGALEPTPSQWQALNIMRGSHRQGRRFFLLRGTASSGKDTVAKEFCAGQLLTKVPVNLGGTYSSGLERSLGTEALQSAEVRRVNFEEDPETGEWKPKMVPAYKKDDDGNPLEDGNGDLIPIMEEDGKTQKMEPDYISDGFSVSGTNLGEIGRSAHLPVCFVISDPDGQEKEFSRLHAALGDDVAKPNGRYVMVDSSSGEILPLHSSTTFVVTTNERRTAKNPDGRFAEASLSRATGIDVDTPDEKEEAKRIAKMVRSQFNLDTPSDIEHKNVAPELGELDITEEEVLPFVRAQRKLVQAAVSGGGNISHEVVARDTADAVAGFIEQLVDDGAGTSIAPMDAFMGRMTKIVPLNGTSPEQRRSIIETIIADEIGSMNGQVGPLQKRLRAIKAEGKDPERAAREKAAAEEASRNEQAEAEEAATEKEEV